MTRQEVIHGEWQKIGIELEYIEGNINLGWRSNSNAKYNIDYRFEVNNLFHRPISLKGIESNNYWVIVNNEKDLPKNEDLLYYHYHLPSKDRMMALNVKLETYSYKEIINLYNSGLLTHYLQATNYLQNTQPQPPIY